MTVKMKEDHPKLPKNVLMLGATGAVGGEALKALLQQPLIKKITLLGRRPIPDLPTNRVKQHSIDIFDVNSYQKHVERHDAAICTLGVGQPSKMSKEEFIRIDKTAVLDFAKTCKRAGIRHFELLASVGIRAESSSFYLRTKGELVEELIKLDFERLSIFKPSMILTPTNRYGIMQGITLAIWPLLKPLLLGGMKKYRGVKVQALGGSFVGNLKRYETGLEAFTWTDFQELNALL